MKLIAKVKLETTGTQLLLRTLETRSECARCIGGQAWDSQTFGNSLPPTGA